MIPVEVVNTFLVNMGKEFVILLRSTRDARTLPISIGQLEAQSIALQINSIPFSRPLTHDLFKNALDGLAAHVAQTEIYDLKEDTFFAHLTIQTNDNKLVLDARPSDAIALALRFAAPIFVHESVMDEAGIIIPDEEEHETAEPPSTPASDPSGETSPLELLRQKLEKAISGERYEDAAQIRDEMCKLTKSN